MPRGCSDCGSGSSARKTGTGSYRTKIEIQQKTRTPDGGGGFTEVWATIITRMAGVHPLRGSQLFAAQQLQSETTHRIELWYVAGVKDEMRILCKGRYFRITGVLNIDEANKVLHIMAAEVGVDG